ncbi:hypothetical protein [Histidinibacterium lentulum]|uniref:Uncharacterized protein n=1 Tax=Histidinibacterium lentulum TaxID=2480588 RepID=A0A3N2R666_9RHOB|nr:hypothetical protein [Histidinibacterium lentulum]ROU02897.1 hypothetical protein EAT49_06240 [Histidinibacterium lentulum]
MWTRLTGSLCFLSACGFGPDPGGPFRAPADLPLPLGVAERLPDGITPSDVFVRTGNADLAGCYYYELDGADVLLDCVG